METIKTGIVNAKFLSDLRLYNAIIEVIEGAKKELVIVSPYLKLNTQLRKSLNSKKQDPGFELYLVFGKNNDNPYKSISEDDLNFFSDFPNVQIIYQEKLHAKYIANERYQIISSMNLYDYSIQENDEAGILLDYSSVFDSLTDKVYNDTYKYFSDLINTGVFIFDKEPQMKKGLIGYKVIKDQYEILVDRREEFFKSEKITNEENRFGYCIRTGVKIPFNFKRPLSKSAFKAWCETGKEDEPAVYCHYSGEKSHGQNSFKYPVLKKNWGKLKSAPTHPNNTLRST